MSINKNFDSLNTFFFFNSTSFPYEKQFKKYLFNFSLFNFFFQKTERKYFFSLFFNKINSFFFIHFFMLNNSLIIFNNSSTQFLRLNSEKKFVSDKNYNFFFSKKNSNNELSKIPYFLKKKNMVFLKSAPDALFHLINLFYKKNKYGFFPLSFKEFFSESITRITFFSQNFNKFFIFKLLKNKKFDYPNSFFFKQTNFFLKFFPKQQFTKKNFLIFNKYGLSDSFLFNKSTVVSDFSNYIFSYFFTEKYKKNFQLNKLTSLNKNNFIFSNNNDKLSFFSIKKNFNFFLMSNIEFFFFTFFSPFLLKFFFSRFSFFFNNFSNLIHNFRFNNDFFYSKYKINPIISNILPVDFSFRYSYKKFLIKMFNYKKLPSVELPLHYDCLIKFLEFCSGKNFFFSINPFMINLLTFEEQTRCLL